MGRSAGFRAQLHVAVCGHCGDVVCGAGPAQDVGTEERIRHAGGLAIWAMTEMRVPVAAVRRRWGVGVLRCGEIVEQGRPGWCSAQHQAECWVVGQGVVDAVGHE